MTKAFIDENGTIIGLHVAPKVFHQEHNIDLNQFVKPSYSFENNQFEEQATTEEIRKSMKYKVESDYIRHTQNGKELYESFRADIVVDFRLGTISMNYAVEIGEVLKSTFEYVITGDFISAKTKCESINALDPVIQPYQQKALELINNYIGENYG